jgi:hypothetical protein
MLARTESPWASHANSNAHGIAREDFNLTASATVSKVVDEETSKAHASLCNPEGEDTIQHKLLWAFFEMDPYSAKSDGSTDNVAVQEHLVEGVANWGRRLK